MKKLVFFYLSIGLFFIGCDYKKDAEPKAHYLSQQHTVRLASLPVDLNFEKMDSLPGGATVAVYDSVYKMKMTWAQGWHADGFTQKMEFIGFIAAALLLFYVSYRLSNNSKDSNSKAFLIPIIAGFACLAISFSAIDWFHTYEKEIKKIDYVHYMQTDGNLEKWWPLPAQKY